MFTKYYLIGAIVLALLSVVIGYTVEYTRLQNVEKAVLVDDKAEKVILDTFEAVKKQKRKDLHEKIGTEYIPTCDANCTTIL